MWLGFTLFALPTNVLAANGTADTTSTNIVGWQAGPQTRGTISLVWSCLLTMFACTWTVQHLNVPGREDGMWQRFRRRCKWMFITVLFPEFIFSKAICDLRQALFDLGEFGKHIDSIHENSKWSVTYRSSLDEGWSWDHEWSWDVEYPSNKKVLYRLLGLKPPSFKQRFPTRKIGFTKRLSGLLRRFTFRRPEDALPQTTKHLCLRAPQDQTEKHWCTIQRWTIVHSYYAQMGGLLMPDPHYPGDDQNNNTAGSEDLQNGRYVVFTSHQATWEYPRHRHPLKYLILDEKAIQNTSKADWFLKAIAILQAVWIILSVSVRGISGLHVTQLEIATVAFAIIAGLTYVANMWKPKDVSESTTLSQFGRGHPRSSDQVRQYLLWLVAPAVSWNSRPQRRKGIQRVPNDRVRMKGRVSVMTVLLAISSFLFGGFHCVAWNFDFPSRTELILWRVGCVISAVLPVMALVISNLVGYISAAGVFLIPSLWKQGAKAPWYVEALFSDDHIYNEWWYHILYPPTSDELEPDAQAGVDENDQPYHISWEPETLRSRLQKITSDETSYGTYQNFLEDLRQTYEIWTTALQFREHLSPDVREILSEHIASIRNVWEGDHDLADFWMAYEAHLVKKLKLKISHQQPISTSLTLACVLSMERVHMEQAQDQDFKNHRRLFYLAAFVSLISSIMYTTARLVTIVLLFTSLRATPVEAYQVTPWLRFVPNIS